jgi:hypothetical protein
MAFVTMGRRENVLPNVEWDKKLMSHCKCLRGKKGKGREDLLLMVVPGGGEDERR